MNQKELSKTFIMILNWKKPFGLHGLYKNISALYGFSALWVNPFNPEFTIVIFIYYKPRSGWKIKKITTY